MRSQNLRSAVIQLILASSVLSTNCEDTVNAQRRLLTLPPPRNLEVEVLDQTRVVLKWEEPLRSARDLEIDGYAVAYNSTKELLSLDEPQMVSWRFVEARAERTCTVDGLRPSTEYEIYLSAYGTHNGIRALSTTVSVRVYTGPLLASVGYVFPVAAMLVITVLASVAYVRIQNSRRQFGRLTLQ